MLVAAPAECGQARRGQCGVVDGRIVVLLEPSEQPPCRDACMPVRRLERDQRGQIEQLEQRRPAELAQQRFGSEQVAALDRPPVDRPRMALLGQRSAFPGRSAGARYQPAQAGSRRVCRIRASMSVLAVMPVTPSAIRRGSVRCRPKAVQHESSPRISSHVPREMPVGRSVR